ncbi:MAG: hypothetical protein J6C40_01890 [Lentisphaeria bacterium]|nr:hypothetical protein [Lentisphaeria bacterium]
MSRRQSEESSLELLLDTMCNTFGGVMFIAISLAVMLSMRGAVPAVSADAGEEIRQAEQQLAGLQEQFERISAERKKAEEFLRRTGADPRLHLIGEIAFLEQTLKNRTPQLKIAEQKRTLAQLQLQNLRNRSQKHLSALAQEKKKQQDLKNQQTALLEKLKKLQEEFRRAASGNEAFSTLSKKDAPPYFILMNDGKVWPIGPDISGSSYTPAPAVTFTAQGGRYVCSAKPGRGTAVFSGGTLSAEFLALLKNIPDDRVPEFAVSPGDAPDFSRLRQLLKERKITHGFRLQRKDQNEFDYQFSNDEKGSYEY